MIDMDTVAAGLDPACSLGQGTLARLAAGRPWEVDVTNVLGRCNRQTEEAVLTLLAGMGIALPSSATILGGSDWLALRNQALGLTGWWSDSRRPDLAVADKDDGWQLVAIAEGKGWAWVNGGWAYCPHFPSDYGNQVACYAHGCWVPEALRAEVQAAAKVWITHDADASDPLHRRGLTAEDAADPVWAPGYRRQQEALAGWTVLDWRAVHGCLGKTKETRFARSVLEAWEPSGIRR